MALIKCPECYKEVSDSAKECPSCKGKIENIAVLCKECKRTIAAKVKHCPFCGYENNTNGCDKNIQDNSTIKCSLCGSNDVKIYKEKKGWDLLSGVQDYNLEVEKWKCNICFWRGDVDYIKDELKYKYLEKKIYGLFESTKQEKLSRLKEQLSKEGWEFVNCKPALLIPTVWVSIFRKSSK